jgi:integrase
MVTQEDVKIDEHVQEYIASRELTKGGARNFISAIFKYCKLHDMTPTELLTEAIDEEDSGVKKARRNIKKRLITFRELMHDEKYKPRYAKTLMVLIRSLYSENDVSLPKISMKKFRIQRKQEEEVPDFDDIKKAMKHANIKFKAIILLMISSGMDSSTVRNLKYQDFYDGIKEHLEDKVNDPLNLSQIAKILMEKDIIILWDIIRSKVQYRHYTCSTPEATRAIIDYLQRYPPERMDDWLFRSRTQKMPDGTVYTFPQISANNFITNFQIINDRCGFPPVGTYRFFHAHSLRARFSTTLINKGVKKEIVDFFLGHVPNHTDSAYNLPKREAMLDIYSEIADHLSLYEEVRVSTVDSDRIEAAEKELNIQKEHNLLLERSMEEMKDEIFQLKCLVEMFSDSRVKRHEKPLNLDR